jgi:putative glycosyltransferase (TIGR04372 family)
MDVFLCAAARFFLGCTSGLSFLSTVFGVPVAQANMIPVETLGIRACDVSMPKLLWDLSLKRYLRFDEIMNAEAGGYFFTHQYRQANLRVDENSPQEILDLATEMLDRIAGCFQETAEDLSLHEKYMAYFKPGHYSYGANSRICIGFLRRHRDLLEDSPA